jgi:O-methyltransferase involved in polyketide biosynthesis
MWHQYRAGNEVGRRGTPASGLDISIPNVARIYDFLLGGKDNFAADREAAWKILKELPCAALACRQNREFLTRVVRVLADSGVRQFLDLGSGLPAAQDNVHEVAQAAAPGSRVVYVDYDNVVVSHARALLESGPRRVGVVEADLRDPGKILEVAGGLIDFGEPVAVLMFAVLHFLSDADQPREVVRSLTEALVPGSALALSHVTGDRIAPDASQAAQQVYLGASAPIVPRSRQDITGFFDGLDLVEPGVTDINLWPGKSLWPTAPLILYGGLALKTTPARLSGQRFPDDG